MKQFSDIILHPLRLRILRILGQHQLTPLQLVERLPDVAQATLYRHLKKLEQAAIIEVVQEKAIRGTVEKTYRLAQSEPDSKALETASSEEWFQLFQRYTAVLLNDMSAYLANEPKPLEDGLSFRQVTLYLEKEELKRFHQDLLKAVQPYLNKEPSKKRRGITLSTMMIPEPESD